MLTLPLKRSLLELEDREPTSFYRWGSGTICEPLKRTLLVKSIHSFDQIPVGVCGPQILESLQKFEIIMCDWKGKDRGPRSVQKPVSNEDKDFIRHQEVKKSRYPKPWHLKQ